jgi:hypothetical protein
MTPSGISILYRKNAVSKLQRDVASPFFTNCILFFGSTTLSPPRLSKNRLHTSSHPCTCRIQPVHCCMRIACKMFPGKRDGRLGLWSKLLFPRPDDSNLNYAILSFLMVERVEDRLGHPRRPAETFDGNVLVHMCLERGTSESRFQGLPRSHFLRPDR